jgi:hypothetical protein
LVKKQTVQLTKTKGSKQPSTQGSKKCVTTVVVVIALWPARAKLEFVQGPQRHVPMVEGNKSHFRTETWDLAAHSAILSAKMAVP